MTPKTQIERDADVERQVAQATLRLRHYRLARDRARAQRLQSSPRLARTIAALLAGGTVQHATP